MGASLVCKTAVGSHVYVSIATKSRSAANNIFLAGTWVGVMTGKWLDGREVDGVEWGLHQPNEGGDTGVLKLQSYEDEYFLFDQGCETYHSVLCKRG